MKGSSNVTIEGNVLERPYGDCVFIGHYTGGPGPAFAQFFDPTVQSLGLTSDVPRSPRLVGMGGLSLVRQVLVLYAILAVAAIQCM